MFREIGLFMSLTLRSFSADCNFSVPLLSIFSRVFVRYKKEVKSGISSVLSLLIDKSSSALGEDG